MSVASPVLAPGPVGGLRRPPWLSALHVLEYDLAVYRRVWRGSIFVTFLQPVLFLAAMGIGLGGFVDKGGSALGGGISYLAFLAPGLLAAAAMQTAAGETTWSIMGRIKWDRTYEAMLATPLCVRDLLLGEIGFVTLRLASATTVFLGVMLAFGAIRSPLGVLAIPAGILTGLAFATPIIAFSATRQNDSGFNVLFRFVITPLFLFSGTFFPIEKLPELLQPVAYVTPLWHGVALARGLTLGTLEPTGAAVHVAVLAAFAAGGAILAQRNLSRRLVK